eukprot:1137851-Pelagomonas_calceolata.AAC.1
MHALASRHHRSTNSCCSRRASIKAKEIPVEVAAHSSSSLKVLFPTTVPPDSQAAPALLPDKSTPTCYTTIRTALGPGLTP